MADKYDAIVIGAGVIGAAVGLELARKGRRTLNLDALPAHGFTFIALPTKVRDGPAGFVRAVGLVPRNGA